MMNERLKAPIAGKQSYIRLRMLFFLTAISFATLLGAAAEYRLHRDALDELNREHDLLDSPPVRFGDTAECLNPFHSPLPARATTKVHVDVGFESPNGRDDE